MHFVTVQSEDEQVAEITQFLVENFRESFTDYEPKHLNDFEDKITALAEQRNYEGILDYLLQIKEDVIRLPTSHSKSPVTF